MLNGVLENLDISWEERLGRGMRIISEEGIEEIIFQHERKGEHILVSILVKDGHSYHTDTYEINNSGMLIRTMAQLIGKAPHWSYEYAIFTNGNLQVTRTNPHGHVLHYEMIITGLDEDRRPKKAEYREIDTNNLVATLFFERDSNGRLKAEILEEDGERQITHLDAAGRYLKMEFFVDGKLKQTIEYLR